ncbi:MAG: GYF domain-containing protein, partial [Bacteroidetes bacterium]|nr:GYF domain-containing protein [Bacteroidota bacterium]
NYSATKIQEYFKGKIIQFLTIQIAKKLAIEKISILEINIYLEELSAFCKNNINEEFKKFGLEIINFFFLSINVPQDDPSVIKLKEAKDIVAKVNITGRDLYQMDRSFDVLEKAADNANGSVGNLMGAGIGLGAGLNMGSQMGNVAGNINTAINPPPPPIPALYYAIINGQQSGAFSFEQITQSINESKINRQTLLWKTGMEAWKAASEFAELSNHFNQIPPTPPII